MSDFFSWPTVRPTVFEKTSCNHLDSHGPFCGGLANVILNESVGDERLISNITFDWLRGEFS